MLQHYTGSLTSRTLMCWGCVEAGSLYKHVQGAIRMVRAASAGDGLEL